MKKILLILFTFLAINLTAQTFAEANYMALKFPDQEWSDWELLEPTVKIVFNDASIIIASEKPQVYIVKNLEQTLDATGKVISAKFYCDDANEIACYVRLQTRTDKRIELYIEYSNVTICYNLKTEK